MAVILISRRRVRFLKIWKSGVPDAISAAWSKYDDKVLSTHTDGLFAVIVIDGNEWKKDVIFDKANDRK